MGFLLLVSAPRGEGPPSPASPSASPAAGDRGWGGDADPRPLASRDDEQPVCKDPGGDERTRRSRVGLPRRLECPWAVGGSQARRLE